MEGCLRVHEVDLRQSLPTVLKTIKKRFGKLDAALNDVVTELRRLRRESTEHEGQLSRAAAEMARVPVRKSLRGLPM